MSRDRSGKDTPTGKLLSVQIKAGASYFRDDDGDSWRVYIRKETINYWRKHSIPVILILVDLHTKKCYWVRGDEEHPVTEKGHRIRVPKANSYDASAIRELWSIAQNQTEVDARLADLENSYSWMQSLHNGASIIVKMTDWIHKSSGRKDFSISHHLSSSAVEHPHDANVPTEKFAKERFTYLGYYSTLEALRTIFPWADVEQYLDEYELESRYLVEEGHWDKEEQRYIVYSGVKYEEWLKKQRNDEGLIESDLIMGEVQEYEFTLELNDLGRSYLVVRDYIYGSQMNPEN